MTKNKTKAVVNGLRLRCPNCGDAPLFRAYLKPVETCSSCGTHWEHVRADDGPAWATMLVVLHVMAPLFHTLVFVADLTMVWAIIILLVFGLMACLWTLPRMKGLFIALIWKTGAPTS